MPKNTEINSQYEDENIIRDIDKISYVLNKTNMHIGVYEYNANMKNVWFTENVAKVLGLDSVQVKQGSLDYKSFKAFLDEVRENPVPDEKDVFCLEKGTRTYVKIEEVTKNDDTLGVVMEVTEEINKRRQLEVERDVDSLTGLYNRRGLENLLLPLLENPKELGRGAFVFVDADGLKIINDKYGHSKGDLYLKKIAEVLKGFGTRGSMAARFGGDEFILFLYHHDTEDELLHTIKALHYIQDNGTACLGDDIRVPLRFSFGACMIEERADYEGMLKIADERMYENKRERKKAQSSQENE